jgi:hypothetical protein
MKGNLRLSTVFIGLLLFGCSPRNAGRHASAVEQATVYFRPGALELISSNQIDTLSPLRPTGKYYILGYSCTEDMLSSKEERLAIADRRANPIRDVLVREGFASQNISTIAYDKGPECKAVIVEIR